MKRIFKYEIEVKDQITLLMPKNAEIISIQVQRWKPYLWALIDVDETKTERYFYLFGTGMEVKDGLKYIGSFQMYDGDLVFHLFEV